METKTLQHLADQLKASSSEADAYFGIFCHGNSPEQTHFKGNADGIKLFTAELLRALAEQGEGESASLTYPLDCEKSWLDKDSEVMIDAIELIPEKRSNLQPEEYSEPTLKDRAILTGCLLLVILAAVFAVIGVVATVQWFF